MSSLVTNGRARRRPHPLLWVLLLTALAYLPSLRGGFVWDDLVIVLRVPAYRNFDWAAIFGSAANTLEYLPLRDLTLALDFKLWGERAFGFRLSNLLLHLAAVALAFRAADALARRVGSADPHLAGLAAALVTGLHPAHVEPVAFVATRNTLLAMVFALAATILFLGAWEQRRRFSAGAVLALSAALLSKASAVFLPLALLLCVPLGRPGERRSGLLLVVPLLLLAAAAAVVHLKVGRASGVLLAESTVTAADTIARLLAIPGFYLAKFFLPWPLAIAYPAEAVFGTGAWVGAALAVALCAALIALARRGGESRLAAVGLAWFVVALGPVLNLAGNATLVADRYAYAPDFGLSLLLAAALLGWRRSAPEAARTWISALAVVPLAWLVLVLWRGNAWQTDLSLRESAYLSYPATGRLLYAEALSAAGREADAVALYAGSDDPMRLYFSGRQALRAGQLARAASDFRQLRALRGELGPVLTDLAETLERMGEEREALSLYRRIESLPAAAGALGAYRQRAMAGRERIGRRLDPEMSALAARAAVDPRDYEALFALAGNLQLLGRDAEAAARYRQAADAAPARWEPWYNLALLHAAAEDFAAALAAVEAAISRAPDFAPAQLRRGLYCLQLGRIEAAAEAFRRTLTLDPAQVEAAWQLARLARSAGRPAEARDWLEQARRHAGDVPAQRQRIEQAIAELSAGGNR